MVDIDHPIDKDHATMEPMVVEEVCNSVHNFHKG